MAMVIERDLFRFFRIRFMPNDTDKARLSQKYRPDRHHTSDIPMERRRSQRTVSMISTG